MRSTLITHLEELLCGAAFPHAVLHIGLFGKVVCILDRRNHPLDREEGGQIRRVGGDQDEGEEPPNAAHDSPREGPGEEEGEREAVRISDSKFGWILRVF